MWDVWVDRAAAATRAQRRADMDVAARAFASGLREEHMYTPEAVAGRQPGRQLVEKFHRCWRALRLELARPTKQGGWGMYLSAPQTRLWEAMRDVLLLKMYGGRIAAYMSDIAYVRKKCPTATELYTSVAIILARRSGKTLVEQLVVNTGMLSINSGAFNPYTMTWNQARTYLSDTTRILGLLRNHDEFGWRQDRAGSVGGRKLQIIRTADMCTTSINVFGNAMTANNAQNLRGTGGNAALIILDEGLFFCNEAYSVILPTIANGAGFVITSSQPPLGTNAIGLLTATMPDTGEPVMKVFNWRPMCLGCEAREKLLQREVHCRHGGAHQPSHFRSRTDERILEALMAPFGSGAHEREMLNRAGSDTSRPYFREAAVAAAFDAAAASGAAGTTLRTERMTDGLAVDAPCFVVSVDPGSKTGPSDTGIVSFTTTHVLPDATRFPPRGRGPAAAAAAGRQGTNVLQTGPLGGYLVVRLSLSHIIPWGHHRPRHARRRRTPCRAAGRGPTGAWRG